MATGSGVLLMALVAIAALGAPSLGQADEAPTCSEAFLAAADSGDEAQLAFILAQGLEAVGCADATGRTPLHHAAASNQREAMLMLLAKGALMTTDDLGRTPLHDAADRGHTESVDLLLKSGAYIEFKDTAQRTPLHHAARRGHSEVVRLLLDRQADITARDGDSRTALHLSARSDRTLNTTRLLCDRGADTEAEDVVKFRPMHFACLENQIGTAEYLLGLSVDVYALDAAGFNPLVHAASRGYKQIATMIIVHLLGPRSYPQPDPALVQKGAQEGGMNIGGVPAYVVAVAFSTCCACLCITPLMRYLRRYSRHQKSYHVHGGDQAIEDFMETVMLHVVTSKEEQMRVSQAWDRIPAHVMSEVHRPKAGAF